MTMEDEQYPLVLLLFALAPTVCFALMWPTGDDDMWWAAVMALPFYGLVSLHHLITKPYTRQRLTALGLVVLMAVAVWSVFFAAFGHPWHWDDAMFISSLAFCYAPAVVGALALPGFVEDDEHRMPMVAGAIMALPLCFLAIMPAMIFLG